MGRYYFSTKQELDALLQIDASFLRKEGYFEGCYKSGTLTWTHSYSGTKNRIGISINPDERTLRLSYTRTQEDDTKKDFDYKVRVETTDCNFGGKRYWFICPLVKNNIPCGRKVRVLYQRGDYFGCRHCHDLTYHSKNEPKSYRKYPFAPIDAMLKIEEIEEKMKIRYYNGKPTRKQKKIDKLYERVM